MSLANVPQTKAAVIAVAARRMKQLDIHAAAHDAAGTALGAFRPILDFRVGG
jgi:hypothetical protein